MNTDSSNVWITHELDRIWLIAERRLREFQRAGLRLPGQPALTEIEAIFAARARGRGNVDLDGALSAVEERLPKLRAESAIGRLTANLQLAPLEVETLVVALAPHVDPPLGRSGAQVSHDGDRTRRHADQAGAIPQFARRHPARTDHFGACRAARRSAEGR